jgi:hypothetical protein
MLSLFSIKANYEFCDTLNMKVVCNAVLPSSGYDSFSFILQSFGSQIYYVRAAGLLSQRFSVKAIKY